ncbi:ABC transporter substrate-binding protein [Streptococcus pneumoniae]|nr:ABC transporter substrate-binding protein [Streptococcus pneumoniae]
MKVVRKSLAPLLVVGLLLTSLISLHQLKADKKKMSFVSVFRSLLPTSP